MALHLPIGPLKTCSGLEPVSTNPLATTPSEPVLAKAITCEEYHSQLMAAMAFQLLFCQCIENWHYPQRAII